MKAVGREILLSFWKVHILHHAGEMPLHGQWMLTELRRRGHEISPGTLYPMLRRMEQLGWLKGKTNPAGGLRARKDYRLTAQGRKVLAFVRQQLEGLHREIVMESEQKHGARCPGAAGERLQSKVAAQHLGMRS